MIIHTWAMKDMAYNPVSVYAWMFNSDCDELCGWFSSIYLDLSRHTALDSSIFENWMSNSAFMNDTGLASPTFEGVDTDLEILSLFQIMSSAASSLSVAFFYKGDISTIDLSGTILEVLNSNLDSVIKLKCQAGDMELKTPTL